ncbi:efflux RND transporter periplasmic adaptor subunit [Uliginosibacterium sp. H3]|uniref:Efflux RND transporter periplasmic adaptor subunit n=1 Tax=Uliginosibacterium silvisoli TaxID=3114758 RepID=A0ABU6K4I9_9RHOO|nr:efflux RND transporter periplasmic adaptor subunit [Uliginosibacterium sp. H3]
MRFPGKILIGLGLVLSLTGCQKKEAAQPAAPHAADVVVQTIQPKDAPVTFEFVGQTESSQQVEIRARVDGFLEQRVYREGAVVKPGQTMFIIDSKPFKADLVAAQSELAQQQARLTTAQANLNRVQPLVAQNALSQKDLDDSKGQTQAAAAAVEAAKAKVTNAQLNLSYATIQSPVAGLSSFAKVQDGAYVNATNNLLTYVAKLDPMRVNFSLSENEQLRAADEMKRGLLKGAPNNRWGVQIVLADGSVYPHTGLITFADAAFSQETGTFLMRAEVPNPQGMLRPGQFVRVRVLNATRPNSIVVPQRAVQQGPKGPYVWLVGKDSKAEQRAIETGEWQGDDWLVTNGLRAGERVVVDGGMRLAPGLPLKPTELQASAASPAASGNAAPAASTAPPPNLPPTLQTQAATTPPPAAAPTAAPTSAAPIAAAGNTTSIYFERASARLDATAQMLLAQLARQAQSGASPIIVSGYVDSEGTPERRSRLALARAETVRQALQEAGVPAERIRLQKPQDIVGDEDKRRARRVDVTAE